jgi:hypothetical protein
LLLGWMWWCLMFQVFWILQSIIWTPWQLLELRSVNLIWTTIWHTAWALLGYCSVAVTLSILRTGLTCSYLLGLPHSNRHLVPIVGIQSSTEWTISPSVAVWNVLGLLLFIYSNPQQLVVIGSKDTLANLAFSFQLLCRYIVGCDSTPHCPVDVMCIAFGILHRRIWLSHLQLSSPAELSILKVLCCQFQQTGGSRSLFAFCLP